MLEGALSGGVLLASKECLAAVLLATPLPRGLAGFVAGAGGGACQVRVALGWGRALRSFVFVHCSSICSFAVACALIATSLARPS